MSWLNEFWKRRGLENKYEFKEKKPVRNKKIDTEKQKREIDKLK